jgi:hypothetical protein
MKARISAIAAAAALCCSAALASETPTITVQANAPGWITVNYYHSGLNGVVGYAIERQEPAARITSYSPNGQWTDTYLTPSTTYAYRACAYYSNQNEPVCSAWVQATTLPPPPPPTNMSPPNITDVGVTTDSLTVSWGAIGEYSKILARLEDNAGHSDQRDLQSRANAAYTFRGLRPDTPYRISLKGCSRTLLGSSCGPWSQAVSIKTAAIPTPPPPPKMTVEQGADSVTYRDPTLAGISNAPHRLDYCLRWGEACGRPAAAAFCKLMDGSKPIVSSYKILPDIGATMIISTGERCDDSGCDSFRYITCKAPKPDGIIVAPSDGFKDVITNPDLGVVTKSPSSYKDAFAKPDAAAATKSSSAYKDAMVASAGSAPAGGCKAGYVPRQARASDFVCVTPEVQARTAQENAVAASRVDPAGAYGPNTCISGYVWREAFEGDLVCVTPDIRAQVREDNRLASSRMQ